MATFDQAVAAYVKLRDMKAELSEQHKSEMAPIQEKMAKVEAWLLRELNEKGIESARTDSGTAYKINRTSAKITDWETLLGFIREHELWSMLERRVSKTSVEGFVEAQGAAPPGVELQVEIQVGVRRG